jgi:hypothetical protein
VGQPCRIFATLAAEARGLRPNPVLASVIDDQSGKTERSALADDDYRRIVRQLRRGSPDSDLKRQVAALKAELKKMKENAEKEWQQSPARWKEINQLRDEIALLDPKPKHGDIRIVDVRLRPIKTSGDTVMDAQTESVAAHHPEAQKWRVEEWGKDEGWIRIGDDHTSMAAACAAAAATLHPESVRAADTSLIPEQRAERMAATDPIARHASDAQSICT